MNIKKNIEKFQKILEQTPCRLVAVTKTKPDKDILEAYHAGHKIFGENKVQELVSKYERLPKDIEWHMIGHLQRNKVKYIAPFVTLIHAVDSLKLLKEINKEAQKNNRQIPCLFQVHIAQEETKFGFDESDLIELFKSKMIQEFKAINVLGLMGMATYTEDQELIRNEFRSLAALFQKIKEINTNSNVVMQELSMGMTNDYEIAIEEGSTLIRVGSAIFGSRN